MLPDEFRIVKTSSLDLDFPGFGAHTFDLLDRLREEATVEYLRRVQPEVREYVRGPFSSYRDDLVVHGVIPNNLPWETERNVFSRLPRNDFGKGGAHHHLWLAFYRPPRTRLTDVQLMHTVHPGGFRWGLYVSQRAGGLFGEIRSRLAAGPAFLSLLNPLLARGYAFTFASGGVTRRTARAPVTAPLATLPQGLDRATALWVNREVPRTAVITRGPALVADALLAMAELWPLYRWMLAAETPALRGGVPAGAPLAPS